MGNTAFPRNECHETPMDLMHEGSINIALNRENNERENMNSPLRALLRGRKGISDLKKEKNLESVCTSPDDFEPYNPIPQLYSNGIHYNVDYLIARYVKGENQRGEGKKKQRKGVRYGKEENQRREEKEKSEQRKEAGEVEVEEEEKEEEVETKEEESQLCRICLVGKKDHVIIPCGHKCLCEACKSKILFSKRCPICQRDIQLITRVYDA